MSYCATNTLHKNVFSCLLLYAANPFNLGAYGVCALICTLYTRQKSLYSPVIYSFSLRVTKRSGIPNLTIQWANIKFNAFAASCFGEG